jgi:DNA polymerase-3 subunit epsilon
MVLQLQRPVAFLDLETTGVNLSTDRIVEIAIVKILPDGSRQEKIKLINPEMPIPADATAIHGITDEKVADAPTFKQVANELKQFLDQCDLAGYNSNRFDIPLLVEEFLRAELEVDFTSRRMVDVQHIFYAMEPRTLTAAYKFYCGKDLTSAHSAAHDVNATIDVLLAQMERYTQLGANVDSILKSVGEEKIVDYARRMIFNDRGQEVFNFGKHKGKLVADVFRQERQYYDWMMNGDFPLHTKKKITEILNRTILEGQKLKK